MAGIKKKSSLRDKASKKSQAAKINEFKQEISKDTPTVDPNYHENPFLKLAKSTKKEKQQVKSDSFISKINLLGETRISKSSLRRRKRKAKEQLKPKLDDLLLNLPESNSTTTTINSKQEDTKLFINKVKRENRPNPTKASGIKHILKQESATFKTALQNRNTNFASLKDLIQQNLKNSAN